MRSKPTHRVLIVDDDADIREALAFVLERAGVAAAGSFGVDDAHRQLREGFHPCVVLLDLHMPGLDGWTLLERMRMEPQLREISAVIMSGDVDQRARAGRAGCEFLRKPMEPAMVLAAIDRRCRRHAKVAAS